MGQHKGLVAALVLVTVVSLFVVVVFSHQPDTRSIMTPQEGSVVRRGHRLKKLSRPFRQLTKKEEAILAIRAFLARARDTWTNVCSRMDNPAQRTYSTVDIDLAKTNAFCEEWNRTSFPLSLLEHGQLLLKLRYEAVGFLVHPSFGPGRAVLALSNPPTGSLKTCPESALEEMRTLCRRDAGHSDYAWTFASN